MSNRERPRCGTTPRHWDQPSRSRGAWGLSCGTGARTLSPAGTFSYQSLTAISFDDGRISYRLHGEAITPLPETPMFVRSSRSMQEGQRSPGLMSIPGGPRVYSGRSLSAGQVWWRVWVEDAANRPGATQSDVEKPERGHAGQARQSQQAATSNAVGTAPVVPVVQTNRSTAHPGTTAAAHP